MLLGRWNHGEWQAMRKAFVVEMRNSYNVLVRDPHRKEAIKKRIWLKHHAASWKVAGSNADEFIRFFNVRNPSGSIIILGLTRPLAEMSTRIFWMGIKGSLRVRLTA
jgi:hypothetical protein